MTVYSRLLINKVTFLFTAIKTFLVLTHANTNLKSLIKLVEIKLGM